MFLTKKAPWIMGLAMATSIGFAEPTEEETCFHDMEICVEQEKIMITESEAPVISLEPEENELVYAQPYEESQPEATVYGLSSEAFESIIDVTTMTEDDLLSAAEGKAILHFPKEARFTLKLAVEGDLFQLLGCTTQSEVLEVQEDFYLGFPPGEELLFSPNLSDWSPFVDFAGGNLCILLDKTEEGLVLKVDLLLEKRPS